MQDRKDEVKVEAEVEGGGGVRSKVEVKVEAEGKAEAKKVRKDISEAIRRVLDGDVESYSEIYELTDRSLRGFIGRRFGRLGDGFVDEAAVRTHEYALKRLADYDPNKGAAYQTWLTENSRSVTSRMLNEWYGDPCVAFEEEKHEERAPSVAGPEEAGETEQVVREAVDCLPEPERTYVRLRFYERQAREVAARHLKLTVGKVRRIERRALEQIEKRVRKEHVRVTEVVPAHEPVWPVYRKKRDDNDESRTTASPVLPFEPGVLVGARPIPAEEENEE